jgi:cation diffusion facilitator family transporter
VTASEDDRPDPAAGRAQMGAVAASAFLVVLKGAGAWFTGSLVLGSAALDSAVDAFVSAASYLVLRRSAAPPDADHAFGHGKFENLAALGQGLLLAGGAVAVVVASVHRLFTSQTVRESGIGIAVLVVSLIVGVAVARSLARIAGRLGSPALQADSLHYRTDQWTNGAALAALLVVRLTGWQAADPLMAIAVAAWVFRTAVHLAGEAAGDLSDRGLPPEDLARIEAVVAAFRPRITGFHDLRTRRSGGQRFISFHLEIPRQSSFEDAHALTVEVLRAVERELPRSHVFVHGDPV